MSDKETAGPAKAGASSANASAGRRVPVVGIGASAGGLEACTALLKALPANLGMAYILVPHLDPMRESAFSEILGRTTAMPVADVKDKTVVEADHVYVIPPNNEMTIVNGVLRLLPGGEDRSVRTTIDTFLRSLAADQGNNAIGVILSGTASDGTMGLAAVKGEGGITFAQDNSAKYDGMPASAIAAGCVDLVLSPEGIAKQLMRIAHHPYVLGEEPHREMEGDENGVPMRQIFSILRRSTHVDFSEYKPPTIGRRVARRMALHKIEKLAEYVALLQRDGHEVDTLYHDLLINVTSFFRDPEAFSSLKATVYPEMLKIREHRVSPIRIWVPGCSTGEETYSHAISLIEYLSEKRVEIPVQIFGTDLSESSVQRARTGIYKDTIETDVDSVRLRRFFHKVDSGYQISKTVRDLCIFSTQNVFNDPPFSRIDLISCRNVMIYLSQSLQKRVIPVFHYALNPTGYLIIGATEGLVGTGSELFEIADRKQKIYRKKAVPTPPTFGFTVHMREASASNEHANQDGKPAEAARVPYDLQREADRLLLTRYAPPSVVVNDRLEIIQTRGHTGKFLELPTGNVSLNLLTMARGGLLHDLQSAIEEARKSGVEAVRSGLHIELDPAPGAAGERAPELMTADLRVIPFKTPLQERSSFLITFDPAGGADPRPNQALPLPLSDDERTARDKQITQLKQELAATREYLQSVIETMEATNEELQSANEEIQSGNEELQSTNEELQTSKEELESANEELHTVNEEMQHRNEQLSQLNNDLNNLLNSVNLPMVMVGPDLSVRRFTPLAAKVLGLAAGDVGRPITRLRLKMDVADLEQLMFNVIADVRPIQRRMPDADGQWNELRLNPYRTADNRIDGVVLSVVSGDGAGKSEGRKASAGAAAAKAKTRSKSVKKRKNRK